VGLFGFPAMVNIVTQQAAGLTFSDVTENGLKLKHAKVKRETGRKAQKLPMNVNQNRLMASKSVRIVC